MPEGVQGDGLTGLALTQRWLESTTWLELPADAYYNEAACTLERLDGETKVYDLMGFRFTDPPNPVYVENKAVNGVQDQAAEYWEFLANAYSITARLEKLTNRDPRYEFIWVTTHPFAQGDWPQLVSADRVHKAVVEKHPECLGDNEVDMNLVHRVADRIWMLVLHQKQEHLLLTPAELSHVEAVLNRKQKK